MKPYKESLEAALCSSFHAFNLNPGNLPASLVNNLPEGFLTYSLRVINGGKYDPKGQTTLQWAFNVPFSMSFENYEVVQKVEEYLRSFLSTEDTDPQITGIGINATHEYYTGYTFNIKF